MQQKATVIRTTESCVERRVRLALEIRQSNASCAHGIFPSAKDPRRSPASRYRALSPVAPSEVVQMSPQPNSRAPVPFRNPASPKISGLQRALRRYKDLPRANEIRTPPPATCVPAMPRRVHRPIALCVRPISFTAVQIAPAAAMFCVEADGWWPYTTTAVSNGSISSMRGPLLRRRVLRFRVQDPHRKSAIRTNVAIRLAQTGGSIADRDDPRD